MFEWETSKEALVWLMGAGSVALFSLLAQYWNWFQGLDSEAKKYISNVIVSVIALVAYGLNQFVPVEVFEIVDPVIKIFAAVLGSVGFKELWYRFVVKNPQK